MAYKIKVGFIGAGNMAGAIIDAIFSSQILPADCLHFFDTDPQKREFYKKRGLNYANSDVELVTTCDVIFLAVKPQVMDDVLNNIASVASGKAFVSIAAGITVAHVKDVLGDSCSVIRVLPNTPMLVLKGATVIAKNGDVEAELMNFVSDVFSAAGAVEFLEENLINCVIPVSSSSPAFFFRMIKAMACAGAENGINYETSLKLAVATMRGAADMLEKSGKTPDELIRQVSSPGGTTIAALSAFDDLHFEKLICEAFARCIKRADELGK